MYITVTVHSPVVPSPLAPVKSARTCRSVVPTLVASESKVPCVVAKALTLSVAINASASAIVPTEIVAAPVSLFAIATFTITSTIC